jgi:hypothetical protein
VKKLYAPEPTGGATKIIPFGSVMYGPSEMARSTLPVASIKNISPGEARIPVGLKNRSARTVTGNGSALAVAELQRNTMLTIVLDIGKFFGDIVTSFDVCHAA